MKMKSLVAAACGGLLGSAALAGDGKVKVGMITTLSGGDAGLGIDVRDGFLLAVKQSGNDNLLVNERTLPMISGWKDQSDYLMNEDVEAIQKMLTDRCTRFARD